MYACLGRPVHTPVVLHGEPPFTVRYHVQRTAPDDGERDASAVAREAADAAVEHSVTFDRSEPISVADRLAAVVAKLNPWHHDPASEHATADSRAGWEHTIALAPLTRTGVYNIALIGVRDRFGCETRSGSGSRRAGCGGRQGPEGGVGGWGAAGDPLNRLAHVSISILVSSVVERFLTLRRWGFLSAWTTWRRS